MDSSSRSEYGGGGVMPNTVFPKGTDALTPSDQLRLQSLTGQETDSRAQVDPYHWYGNLPPNLARERTDRAARLQREQQRVQQEARRYIETPTLPY